MNASKAFVSFDFPKKPGVYHKPLRNEMEVP
jgi:hypothetical protein